MLIISETESWEDLRKQARYLENEIDKKLVALSKMNIDIISGYSSFETVPLLDEKHVFENMASEIESFLDKLVSVNEKMNDVQPNGAVMFHIIRRHKEILKDYEAEFNKVKKNFIIRDRSNEVSERFGGDDNMVKNLNHRDLYLKESQLISNSDRLISDQINIAMETRDQLMSQRHIIKRIRTRLNDVSNRFPVVNSLLQRIRQRKRRDFFILCFIIGSCICLMLYQFIT